MEDKYKLPDKFNTITGIRHYHEVFKPYYEKGKGLYIPEICDDKLIYMLISTDILRQILEDIIKEDEIPNADPPKPMTWKQKLQQQ